MLMDHYVYLGYIKVQLAKQFDVVYRNIETPRGKITLVFIESMIDSNATSQYIIEPLQTISDNLNTAEDIKRTILQASDVADIQSPDTAIEYILSGNVVILFEFLPTVLACNMKNLSKRAVETTTTDFSSQGPQEGFNEALLDNTCLIRRRVKNPNLRLEKFTLGRLSRTPVILAYIEGLAPPALVRHMRRKLTTLDLDFVLDTSYIAEQLKARYSVFDTTATSERPDTIASRLFEGRLAILVDGTSFVLTLPGFFLELFQAADDYYLNIHTANFARLIRVLSLFISLMLPGLYVALTTNHLNLLPTTIAFRIATSRATVPFPLVIEVVLMLMFFEFTKKAGKRLPSQIGQPLSIVSALILGQAAIDAGLTSESTVVVMGIYAITSFINPKISSGASMWSVLIILLSATVGLHGFFTGLIMMAAHLTALKSAGYPFLFPVGTAKRFYSTDFLLRSNVGKISTNLLKRGETN